MKYICLMFISLAFISLSWNIYKPTEAQQLVSLIFSKTSHKAHQQFGLNQVGTKVAMPGGEIRKLGLYFSLSQSVNFDESREIIVEVAQTFLEEILRCEKIKPFLVNKPWNINNITVSIQYLNEDGDMHSSPNIGYTSLINGIITYYGYNQGSVCNMEKLHQEMYEEL